MKRLFLLFFFCFGVASAQVQGVPGDSYSMTLGSISLKQFVLVHYDFCTKRGFVIDPVVGASLSSEVTLKVGDTKCSASSALLEELLHKVKLRLVKMPTFDLITAAEDVDGRAGFETMVYVPKYREAQELAELAQIAIRKGSFAHQRLLRGVVSSAPAAGAGAGAAKVAETGTNGASITSKPIDRLVFVGPRDEAQALQALFEKVDVPRGQVEIRVGVYEYSSSSDTGGGVQAALKLFGQRLTFSAGDAVGSVLKLATGSIEMALDLLDRDSRFKYVARPKLVARDGQSARFFGGEEVRVTGAVVLDQSGRPIQSRETLSAGVTLEVTPTVLKDVVDLALKQSVSSFVSSSSGSDPSTLRRELATSVSVQPGVVYLIGGLQSGRREGGRSRLFGFGLSDRQASQDSEVILLLSVSLDAPGGSSAAVPGGSL